MLKNGCETGCKSLTGGEVYHHKDCQFYKGSLSEELDKLREQVKKLNEPAVSKCDGIERAPSVCPKCGSENVLWVVYCNKCHESM